MAWIASLPPAARPSALATKFARIANNFAMMWDQLTECRFYFDELFTDRRGGRQGFPPDVLQDLIRLRELHASLFPLESSSPWTMGNRRW